MVPPWVCAREEDLGSGTGRHEGTPPLGDSAHSGSQRGGSRVLIPIVVWGSGSIPC